MLQGPGTGSEWGESRKCLTGSTGYPLTFIVLRVR